MLAFPKGLIAEPTNAERVRWFLRDNAGVLVAERDKLSRLQAPDAAPALNAERYEVLLPYAVALDVEDGGTRKFTAVVGVTALAAATQRMGWYSGTGGAADLSDFSRAIGSSLTSSIAAHRRRRAAARDQVEADLRGAAAEEEAAEGGRIAFWLYLAGVARMAGAGWAPQ